MRKNHGLTLIELLIVVAIIAILAVIVLAALFQIKKAQDSKRKGHLAQLKVVLEDYYSDKNCYPTDLNCDPGIQLRPYINQVPCNTDGQPYYYELDQTDPTCPQWFRIYTHLENPEDAEIPKLGCEVGCGPSGSYNFGVSSDNISLEKTGSDPNVGAPPSSCSTGPYWACLNSGDPNCNEVSPLVGKCLTAETGVCYCTSADCLSSTSCGP